MLLFEEQQLLTMALRARANAPTDAASPPLSRYYSQALEQRVSLFEEQQLLTMALRARANAPTDAASRARERQRQEEDARQRDMVMAGLRNVASQLASSGGPGGSAAAAAGSSGPGGRGTGFGVGPGNGFGAGAATSSAAGMLGAPIVTAPVSTGITAASVQAAALGFGVQAERERIRQGVFRPSHTMPTMTVEEFGRLELKEAMEREQVCVCVCFQG